MNPTRSQNSAVTTLRSSATGRADAVPSGVAHSMQNFAPSGFSWPQFEQVSTRDAIPRAVVVASARPQSAPRSHPSSDADAELKQIRQHSGQHRRREKCESAGRGRLDTEHYPVLECRCAATYLGHAAITSSMRISGRVHRWPSASKRSCAPKHEADVTPCGADDRATVWATVGIGCPPLPVRLSRGRARCRTQLAPGVACERD